MITDAEGGGERGKRGACAIETMKEQKKENFSYF